MRPSFLQIAIVVLIIVIIFGAPKLPMLARSLGQSLKIFKSEVKDLRDDENEKTTEPGELGRETSQTAPRTAPDAASATASGEASAAEKNQDPQPREK